MKKHTLEDILLLADLSPQVIEVARQIRHHENEAAKLRVKLTDMLQTEARSNKERPRTTPKMPLVSPKTKVKKKAKKASEKNGKAFPTPSPEPAKREAATASVEEDVLAALELKSPQTLTGLKTETRRDFYAVTNVVKSLEKEGVIEKVTFRPHNVHRDVDGYRLKTKK